MTGKVTAGMIDFFGTDRRRIAHALKVYAYAAAIAELEQLSPEKRELIALAALLHDVGIKIAEAKYGSCTARQQEDLGPDAAAEILSALDVPAAGIDRIKFLIAHHHSPAASEDIDFRVLLEADFLVNFEEGYLPLSSVEPTARKHFRTKSGLSMLRIMFPSSL
jgi:predicted metal-dependent HD superfamily phosphohydrolase